MLGGERSHRCRPRTHLHVGSAGALVGNLAVDLHRHHLPETGEVRPDVPPEDVLALFPSRVRQRVQQQREVRRPPARRLRDQP
eukprot:4397902-Pyramimonas_sp.AAC.1